MDFAGKREWVYPLHIKGRFQRYRQLSFLLLQLFLFVTPWLTLNGHQLVRFDLPHRQFFIGPALFSAHDTIFVLLVLLFLSFLLFFVTSLFGRVWCGYACPQTVFLETWVHTVERFIEGERGARIARDKGPWNFARVWRKAAKWSIFAVVSAAIGMTFVSWFAGTRPLWHGEASGAAYASVAFFSGLAFLDLAWFREQFCNFLCPYARFQGVLAGPNSLVVGYDKARGEPRHKRRADTAASTGACIDCNKCVAVCPTGIDIRNGYQLECIGCARCIDACTPIMAKFNELSLVRYSTVERDEGRPSTGSLLRGRPLVYGGALVAIALAFLVLLGQRHTVDVTANHMPGNLYTIDADGYIRNTLLLNITNKSPHEVDVTITVEGLDNPEVVVPPVHLAAGQDTKVPLVVRLAPDPARPRTTPMDIRVHSDVDELVLANTFKSGE